jgi:hypothetical protein
MLAPDRGDRRGVGRSFEQGALTMIHRTIVRHASGLTLTAAVAALALSNGGCSAADNAANNVAGAASGCDEFAGGSQSIAALQIDATTKQFLVASSDFVGIVSSMETSVYTACKQIDTDLGVTDTWSAKPKLDDQVTEACTQASAKITAILNEGVSVQAACYLSVSGGGCQVDANVEASCEAQCTGMASCTPPDVTVTCDPGQLSVECSGTCNAMATCEGTVTAAAQCQGSCSADCSGECDVTATAPKVHCEGTCGGHCTGTCDGTAANGTTCAGTCNGTCDATCTYTGGVSARCDGSCKGTCTGDCKLDANANVMCGANVRCKGGCTGTATYPQCEGTIKPAMCSSDVNCQASCQGHAEAKATCTPPTVVLKCDANATPDMVKLVATLEANMPVILQVVDTQGPIAADAAVNVGKAGLALGNAAGSIGGKGLVCAVTAASAAGTASASLNVSVMVSVSVSASCNAPPAG